MWAASVRLFADREDKVCSTVRSQLFGFMHPSARRCKMRQSVVMHEMVWSAVQKCCLLYEFKRCRQRPVQCLQLLKPIQCGDRKPILVPTINESDKRLDSDTEIGNSLPTGSDMPAAAGLSMCTFWTGRYRLTPVFAIAWQLYWEHLLQGETVCICYCFGGIQRPLDVPISSHKEL